MVEGCKAMLIAMIVLTLAWSIGAVSDELHTAAYVVGLTEGVLSASLAAGAGLPALGGGLLLDRHLVGDDGDPHPLVIPIAHGLAMAGGHRRTGDSST
jgi:hypothetical protein